MKEKVKGSQEKKTKFHANQLLPSIESNRFAKEGEAYENLLIKSQEHIDKMVKDGKYSTELKDLDSLELSVLLSVVDKLRDDGYRYCLVETVDTDGSVLGYRLRISVKHLI